MTKDLEQQYSKEKLDLILSEISKYQVTLESDPTLPNLGTKYLQTSLSQCRNYLNRIQYYYQLVKRMERETKIEVKMLELNIEFQLNEKLAEDNLVRREPSISDRKAVAMMQLKSEFDKLSQKQAELLDIEETGKIIKSQLEHLKQTNNDIKMQRNMVKDDKMSQLTGGDGFDKPQVRQDKSMADGMPAPVDPEPLGPKEILDPNKRPDDLPEPIDEAHAQQMSEFLRKYPVKRPATEQITKNGLVCSVCKSPQLVNFHGTFCENGHGGVEGVEPEPEPVINSGVNFSYDDILS